jgi:hypothetical protein
VTKLTKAQIKARDMISGKLSNLRDELTEALEKYNEAVADLFSNEETGLKVAIDAYNEELKNARTWAEEIASDIEGYYDERSDAWKDGDKGQAVEAWKSTFEDFSVEDVEFEDPEALEIDTEDVMELIDQLPESCD